ncbi:hypothetical protein IV203_016399 [Nitzschia inconspicua]|uniref:Uncharacterized protein n=1 Tax=Nitzschia inconspicua TaxID=303405 RepID=A0A9K3KR29_9STRA|nr:hypothetical protein IV203_016399 [Nitzschia inconspicua]
MRATLYCAVALSLLVSWENASAFSIPESKAATIRNLVPNITNRRKYLIQTVVGTAFGSLIGTSFVSSPAAAFDGSGSSAYAGRSPATKAELKKQYKERVVADVKDFVVLGKAIDQGETEGRAWINFFITAQRREPDAVGRTYAALVDLRGLPTKKASEYEGGDGLLLANTFTKAGKPPDNTPAVRSFLKVSKTFDAIEAAGKSGNASKAKEEWAKSKTLLEAYLVDVELPGSISDPLYQP